MARRRPPSRFEKIIAPLECNRCKEQFHGPALFQSITTADLGNVGRVPAGGGAAEGNRCPECGSELIRVNTEALDM